MKKFYIKILALILTVNILYPLRVNASLPPTKNSNNMFYTRETTYGSWSRPQIYFPNVGSSHIGLYSDFSYSRIPKSSNFMMPLYVDEDEGLSSFTANFVYNDEQITDLKTNEYEIDFQVSSNLTQYKSIIDTGEFNKHGDGYYIYNGPSIKGYRFTFNSNADNPSSLLVQMDYRLEIDKRFHDLNKDENKPIVQVAPGTDNYPKVYVYNNNPTPVDISNGLPDSINYEPWYSDSIYLLNPTITGSVYHETLPENVDRPSGTNLVAKNKIKIDLIEKTASTERVAGSTISSDNGSFAFSNIDENKENDFYIEDSKNELFIRVDNQAYIPWTFHNNQVEEMTSATSNLAKITDIARYEFSSDLNMNNFYWQDYFEELKANGERARDFKIILTDKQGLAKSSVLVNYLDEAGNKIAPSETLEGLIGQIYKSNKKSIPNYKFLKLEGASPEGVFTDTQLTVNYIYKKEVGRGSVVAKYLDVHGNDLASSETFYGEVGSPYTTSRKTISKYSFKKIEGADASGKFINGELVVKYIYDKDSDTKDPKKPEPEKPKPVKPKPPTREIGKIIEPKVEYELNRKDHFAYIKGYPDITVQPNGYITREEVSMVFYRIMEPEYREQIETTNHNFTDIQNVTWSTKAIATLTKGNILKGYEDQTFKPHNNMTRGEIAKVIARFADVKILETQFPDVIGHWAEDYINTAQDQGWISGYKDGDFKPNELLTRAEFVTMVNNLLDRRVKKENALPNLKQFKDLPEEWYYNQMIEAINGHEYELKRLSDGTEVWTKLVDTEFPDK